MILNSAGCLSWCRCRWRHHHRLLDRRWLNNTNTAFIQFFSFPRVSPIHFKYRMNLIGPCWNLRTQNRYFILLLKFYFLFLKYKTYKAKRIEFSFFFLVCYGEYNSFLFELYLEISIISVLIDSWGLLNLYDYNVQNCSLRILK